MGLGSQCPLPKGRLGAIPFRKNRKTMNADVSLNETNNECRRFVKTKKNDECSAESALQADSKTELETFLDSFKKGNE